jgi:amino acid efflux transporter
MGAGLGGAGRSVTAGLAVLLTMGTMNTYVAASTRLVGVLAPRVPALPSFAGVASVLLVALACGFGLDGLMRATSAAFVAVYVVATAAGVRLLSGRARVCAGIGFGAVLVVFAFSGPFVLVPIAIAAGVSISRRPVRL